MLCPQFAPSTGICEWCGRPRWLPTRQHADRVSAAVRKYQAKEGGWKEKPDRVLADISKNGVSCNDFCPWTAEAMDAIDRDELKEVAEEFDLAHGTSGAVYEMMERPPCGLPLPTYRDQYRLFLNRDVVLDGVPDLVRWRMSKPLTADDTYECFRRLNDYTILTLGFSKSCHPKNLVTGVQVVPPPRMRITSFGASEDDLTFFLRELIKVERLLAEAKHKHETAKIGGEGATDEQKWAAEVLKRLSVRIAVAGPDERAEMMGDYVAALEAQEEACKDERAEEDMLWKVLSCRVSTLSTPTCLPRSNSWRRS